MRLFEKHSSTRFYPYIAIAMLLISSTAFSQPKPGQKVPEVSLPDTKGAIQKLSALTGKVVLIDFWASWCGPCRKTNPILVKLYDKYKSKGFEIYGISIDEEKGAWQKAIAADKMSWTHVIEQGGWDGPVASAWKIQQVPTSYLVDKSGKVVAVDPGTLHLEHKIVEQLKR